jgi:arylsulfatase A-like enzyme
MRFTDFYPLRPFVVVACGVANGPVSRSFRAHARPFPTVEDASTRRRSRWRSRYKDLGYATACIGKWIWAICPLSAHTAWFRLLLRASVQQRHDGGVAQGPAASVDAERGGCRGAREPSHHSASNAEEAVQFITKSKDKPFFLYLAHSMPHVPFIVPRDSGDARRVGFMGM